MRLVVLLWLACTCLAAGTAEAQEQAPAPTAVEETPAAEIHVDPVTGRRYREERPPEGLQRGRLQVTPELAVGAGAVVALLAAWALVRQVRRRA